MASQFSLDLKGLHEYMEHLAQAGEDVDAAAARAVLTGAELAQDGMVRRVPVDKGNLRDHIQIKGPDQDGNYISVEVGLIHDRNYTDAETARYGNAQEYGTSSMAAQPYIRPTMQGDRRKIRQAMIDSLKQDGKL